jgi:signal peptidase
MGMACRIVWTMVILAILGVGTAGAVLHAEGYGMYVIHTGSMTPTYRPGDLVIDRPPQQHYRPGEVITFLHTDRAADVVTHRITEITPAGLIHTKGDANSTADVWEIRPEQVQGSAILGARRVGYFLVFLKQPAGILSIASAVFGLLLLWTLFFPQRPDQHGPDKRPAGRGAHRAGDDRVTRQLRLTRA